MVETFTDDMVQVIEDSQGGLIKKIIQEQEKHEIEKKNYSPESKRNKAFMLVSSILILLTLGLLAFLYTRKGNEPVPLSNAQLQINSIIYTDKVKLETLDQLTKEQIADKFLEETNIAEIKGGEIEGIYGTENGKVVGLRRFTALIKGNFIPGDSSLVSDNFLMGTVSRDERPAAIGQGGDFFILLQVRSFIDAFTPMRVWENKMFSDLHIFFGLDLNATSSYLLTKNFEDGFIENKNARILYDAEGNFAMMYVFADEHSVVIAKSPNAVHEVMLRLASSRIKK